MTELEEFEFRHRLEQEQGGGHVEKPKVSWKQALLPRTMSGDKAKGPQNIFLDIFSLPGRIIGSTDQAQLNKEEMAKTRGENLTQQILRDPALIPSMAAGGGAAGLAEKAGITGLKALGLTGLAEGATGAAVHQADNASHGEPVSPYGAAFETVFGPLLSTAPTVGKKIAGRIGSGLSGASEEALRTYGTGFGKEAANIRAAAGKTNEVGQRLTDAIENAYDYMPERQAVDAALKGMPEVDISRTIQSLQDEVNRLKKPTAGAGAFGFEQKAIKELEGDIAALRGRSSKFPKTKFPAEGVRDLRRRLDVETKFGDESDNLVNSARIRARTQLKNDLIDAANMSGNPEYVKAMEDWHSKIEKVNEVKKFLGKDAATRKHRVEGFLSNLDGKNKTERQKLVKDLGEIFGEDFLAEAKLSNMADELGPQGKPDILPRQTTGRSGLGLGIIGGGGAGAGVTGFLMTGDPKYLAIPAVTTAVGSMSSPRVAATALGSMDFMERLLGPAASPARSLVRSVGQRRDTGKKEKPLSSFIEQD